VLGFSRLAATWIATLTLLCMLAAPVRAADEAGVSGTWILAVETSRGTGTPTLTLKQEGENITGTYKGQLGEAPVTGTLKGKALTLSFKIGGMMGELPVVYTGTVEGNTMQGTAKIGPENAKFTGKRG
jgi:hypothetical protein